MAEEVGGSKKGSFQNQASSSSDQRRRASKEAESTRASLQHAGALEQWSSSNEAKKYYCSTICESAAKELDSFAAHMPNLPDTDARTHAL